MRLENPATDLIGNTFHLHDTLAQDKCLGSLKCILNATSILYQSFRALKKIDPLCDQGY